LRARSKRLKDKRRFEFWLMRKLQRRMLLAESYWDPERCELVALRDYPLLRISRGEVLFDRRGYVNPSLSGYR